MKAFLLSLLLLIVPCSLPAQISWSSIKSSASALYNKSQYEVPVTGRKFTNLIPNDILYSLCNDQYKKYVQRGRSSNSKYKAQLNRVAGRLRTAVTELYRQEGRSSELSNFHWEFNVLKSSDANAFCMYGGKIAVYEGMFSIATDDASLAVVLAHEAAHAIAKHSAEQMTKNIITAGGVGLAYAFIASSDMSDRKKSLAKAMAVASATLASLKFSRIDETEADRIGLILVALAGYNPEAAIPFWERMEAKSKLKTTRDWFSTHPSYANRIQNIRSCMPEAKKYYRK